MKVGVIGSGFVGKACAKALLLRGSCHEIVLLDSKVSMLKDEKTGEEREIRLDQGVATDLSHGALLCPRTRVRHGGYDDMADAAVVVITAGINEMTGRAIDRDNAKGRLLLLPENARVYDQIVPEVVRVAPKVPILVVTDPPDPLADVALRHVADNQVISAGTYLDTLRFRLQVGQRLGCNPASVNAIVIGEHGTSQVYVWSSAQIGGRLVLDRAEDAGWDRELFRKEVEQAVRFANIDIIEGTGASQHGIGIVTARIVEAMLRDEGLVEPIGVRHKEYGVTLSLPSVIARQGVTKVLPPTLSAEESKALEASASAIADALAGLEKAAPPVTTEPRDRARTATTPGP